MENKNGQGLQVQKVVFQKKEDSQKVKNFLAIENLKRTIGIPNEEEMMSKMETKKMV